MLADGNDNNLNLISEDAASELAEYAKQPVWEYRFKNLRQVLDANEPDYID